MKSFSDLEYNIEQEKEIHANDLIPSPAQERIELTDEEIDSLIANIDES